MNLQSIVRADESVGVLAIGVCRTRHGNTHTGIAYRNAEGELLFFHQAWHHDTRNEPIEQARRDMGGQFLSVIPFIEVDRARNIAALCELIAGTRQPIAYALHDDPEALFDENTGVLTLPNGRGLNCSTFVLALFRSARFPLVDTTDWPTDRPGDQLFQESLVRILEKTGADPDHIAKVRAEIGCARIRPEEVAGAAIHESLPVRHTEAEHGGQVILTNLG